MSAGEMWWSSMQTVRSRRLTGLLLALGMLLAAGCGDANEARTTTGATATTRQATFAAGTTMARLQTEGAITVGVKFDAAPFGAQHPTSGDVEGFDIDLARAIADALGVEPKYTEAVQDNRIEFLKDGTADLILSTLTVTPERDADIDFSEPYFVAQGRILVKNNDGSIKGVDDLAGKDVCTALGSTYEETLAKRAPKAKLRLTGDYSECLELIQNGLVDAIVSADVVLAGMIIQDDTLKLVGEGLTTEPFGAGVREDDTAFRDFVDGVIAKYKSDGRWATAYKKWVGQYTGEDQNPPTMTLREALDLSE